MTARAFTPYALGTNEKVGTTIREMFTQRGYTKVVDVSEFWKLWDAKNVGADPHKQVEINGDTITIQREKGRRKVPSELKLVALDENYQFVYYFFSPLVKFGVGPLRRLWAWALGTECQHAVLVTPSLPTAHALKVVHNSDFVLETFTIYELMYNLTKHSLYSPHRVVTPQEISSNPLLTDPTKLPRIMTNDPVVKFFHWSVGTILEIHMRYGEQHFAVDYRVVTAPSDTFMRA